MNFRLVCILVVLSGGVVSAQGQNDNVAVCDRHGITTVVTCILHDLREVARKDSLTWLAGGGLVAVGSLLVDDEITTAVTDPESHAWLAPGDALGTGGWHFAAPLALYAVARAVRHPGTADLGVMLLRTQVVNGG